MKYTNQERSAVPGFDIVLSLARMAIGNAKPESFAAVRHQVFRLRDEMKHLGHRYQTDKLTDILAEGPSPTHGQRLIRS